MGSIVNKDVLHKRRAAPSSTVGLVNLGCVRNTVDSQNILGRLGRKGYRLTAPEKAEVVIVNTCSFIEDARKESVEAILDAVALKKKGKVKKVVVAGCLSQRYGDDLAREFPEVDAFVGVQRLSKDERQETISLTPPHYAYLKICESCFNRCSFCVIPRLKGRFTSRSIESILADVRDLDSRGVRELNIVGQDITAYGLDLYQGKKLAELLRRMVRECDSIGWMRLLYAYPSHVTEELLEVIASEPKICKYIDIPLQHVGDRVLRDMRRHITRDQTVRLIEKVRRMIPGVFLRTTFIVGFPEETSEEFKELVDFVRQYRFERVGVFVYSREEGTPAYGLPGQVPRRVKQARYERLMEAQQQISRAFLESRIGSRLKVLVEGRAPETKGLYLARSEFDAPDVDGMVHVRSSKALAPGQFVLVDITGANDYDLEGDFFAVGGSAVEKG